MVSLGKECKLANKHIHYLILAEIMWNWDIWYIFVNNVILGNIIKRSQLHFSVSVFIGKFQSTET